MKLSTAQRIDRLCIPEPNSGCWLWLGVLDLKGYGRMGIEINGVWMAKMAHRISWAEINGDIPDGLNILHRCDVPCCVNPEHLFPGTQLDNMTDMHAKGRYRRAPYKRGAEHFGSKLTEAQALYVLASPKQTSVLAVELGVSHSCLSDLRHRRTWKHLQNHDERNAA